MPKSGQIAAICAAALFLAGPSLAADQLPILTISGSSNGAHVEKKFDRSQLEQMGTVDVKTSTPWNQGVVDFEGVPMKALLEKAGVGGSTATVTALNDYSVDVPTEDFSKYQVILAIKRNGNYMPVDDQGPYFIIYPFDSDPALQGQPYHSRAVWQVKAIDVH